MTAVRPWYVQEPDESPEDWMLRIVISRAAIAWHETTADTRRTA